MFTCQYSESIQLNIKAKDSHHSYNFKANAEQKTPQVRTHSNRGFMRKYEGAIDKFAELLYY